MSDFTVHSVRTPLLCVFSVSLLFWLIITGRLGHARQCFIAEIQAFPLDHIHHQLALLPLA
jgi:hypothetical protein